MAPLLARSIFILHNASASRVSRLGESGSVRKHCSDDAKDIKGFSSENNEDLGDERWNSDGWKFQAEMLRAECNLLRMEKEVAVRRWEHGCAEMEHAVRMVHSLHSAIQVLIMGRKKIVDEKNAEVMLQTTLQNQIGALQEKLEKLRKNSEFRENELKKCTNFNHHAMFLQRILDNLHEISKDRSYSEDTAKALQQRMENLVLAGCSTAQSVAPLRKRLDYVSMGMNESKEAAANIRNYYRSILNNSINCSSRRTNAAGRAEQACKLHC